MKWIGKCSGHFYCRCEVFTVLSGSLSVLNNPTKCRFIFYVLVHGCQLSTILLENVFCSSQTGNTSQEIAAADTTEVALRFALHHLLFLRLPCYTSSADINTLKREDLVCIYVFVCACVCVGSECLGQRCVYAPAPIFLGLDLLVSFSLYGNRCDL